MLVCLAWTGSPAPASKLALAWTHISSALLTLIDYDLKINVQSILEVNHGDYYTAFKVINLCHNALAAAMHEMEHSNLCIAAARALQQLPSNL